jgi:hypothetical protein
MVLQNIRDICKAVTKELIIRYKDEENFNKWSHETIIGIIGFIKPKKEKEGTILNALIDGGYLYCNEAIYGLGPRVKVEGTGWAVC